ncbi:hypothetical protein [Rhizobium arsenicireducens]
MWLHFDDNETAFLVELLARELKEHLHVDNTGVHKLQAILEKLTAEPDPDTAAFASAVQTSDELEVDGDVVISRGDEGAFVMSWSWVSNEEAGIEDNDDEP